MNSAVVAGILALLGAAPGQMPPATAPSSFSTSSETVESGRLATATGEPIDWQIRLLPIASFPEIPPAVAAQLALRQCMIPQSFEAQQPENVIHGALRAPGTDDWAMLCSVRGVTTLYVFFAGQFDAPVALRRQRDTDWLGAEPGSHTFGSAWGIALSHEAELRASPEVRRQLDPEHDGIEDSHLERSSILRYDQNGTWLALSAGN